MSDTAVATPPAADTRHPEVIAQHERLNKLRDEIFALGLERNIVELDLNDPLVDYTIGWVDPMGAHSDFKNPEVLSLLSWFADDTPFTYP